jgi:hypothetical protein
MPHWTGTVPAVVRVLRGVGDVPDGVREVSPGVDDALGEGGSGAADGDEPGGESLDCAETARADALRSALSAQPAAVIADPNASAMTTAGANPRVYTLPPSTWLRGDRTHRWVQA